jgi:RsiW-degrading membrane proteinase PrsW (M82 family)
MSSLVLARAPIALLPVLVFLLTLVYFDSFRLVRPRVALSVMAAGAVAACVSYPLNGALLDLSGVTFPVYVRYISPWLEELLKALILIHLIRTRHIGLLVDAAIAGFAVGTGFALVENLYYLALRPEAATDVQVIRGFGTAIMHGGATAIFGIVSIALVERKGDTTPVVFVPGWVGAVLVHSAFNHLLVAPLLATLAILLALPPLIYFVFQHSERSLRHWLEADLDSDIELVRLIDSGEVSETHLGKYIDSIKHSYRGEVVADMLCYLRLHGELALRAKGMLLMRESGIDDEIDDETRAKLAELEYLERSIGRSGQLALRPLLLVSGKDLWQLHALKHSG